MNTPKHHLLAKLLTIEAVLSMVCLSNTMIVLGFINIRLLYASYDHLF